MKPFAVIKFDYPENSDVWEFDTKEEAQACYDSEKKSIRERNSIMLVEVLQSQDSQ